ncbi:FkbM family methyltransferase [Paraflavitalea pollutisoli]|uniref:FkbM family methyltransferase n=1 Tax=Paraflavitalea pollutisoli TaxID=3034143 RepID=UPI0023EB9D64|nr:FkbM family methyltransferase [Paraflavitalea sp. H1-2-19X]
MTINRSGNFIHRLSAATSKLLFCCKVSRDLRTWFRLITNTKKLSWSAAGHLSQADEATTSYHFTLARQPATLALRTLQGDLQIFYDVWWRSTYQLPNAILQRAAVIVDLGAHVGMTSLYFSRHAPNATIYPVEADNQNYELLCSNLAPVIQTGRVVPTHAAIHHRQEPVYLQKEFFSYNTHVAETITEWPVDGIRLADLITLYELKRIDILKIDIEGAEKFLLQEADTWMPITQHILIELHDDQLRNLFLLTAAAHGFQVTKRPMAYEDIYWASR